jgi:hypothetical protein
MLTLLRLLDPPKTFFLLLYYTSVCNSNSNYINIFLLQCYAYFYCCLYKQMIIRFHLISVFNTIINSLYLFNNFISNFFMKYNKTFIYRYMNYTRIRQADFMKDLAKNLLKGEKNLTLRE